LIASAKRLHELCAAGDTSAVLNLLQTTAATDGKDAATILLNAPSAEDESTPVMVAARHGHAGLVPMLILLHSPTRAVNKYDRSALHVAAAGGHIEICMQLMSCGASLLDRDTLGLTPIGRAMMNNQKATALVLTLLLMSIEDMDAADLTEHLENDVIFAAQHRLWHVVLTIVLCCRLRISSMQVGLQESIRRQLKLAIRRQPQLVDACQQLVASTCELVTRFLEDKPLPGYEVLSHALNGLGPSDFPHVFDAVASQGSMYRVLQRVAAYRVAYCNEPSSADSSSGGSASSGSGSGSATDAELAARASRFRSAGASNQVATKAATVCASVSCDGTPLPPVLPVSLDVGVGTTPVQLLDSEHDHSEELTFLKLQKQRVSPLSSLYPRLMTHTVWEHLPAILATKVLTHAPSTAAGTLTSRMIAADVLGDAAVSMTTSAAPSAAASSLATAVALAVDPVVSEMAKMYMYPPTLVEDRGKWMSAFTVGRLEVGATEDRVRAILGASADAEVRPRAAAMGAASSPPVPTTASEPSGKAVATAAASSTAPAPSKAVRGKGGARGKASDLDALVAEFEAQERATSKKAVKKTKPTAAASAAVILAKMAAADESDMDSDTDSASPSAADMPS
ncbi:MAG: ankyrin repeat domain-containing protein, partial [Methanobacteriota archaeon]